MDLWMEIGALDKAAVQHINYFTANTQTKEHNWSVSVAFADAIGQMMNDFTICITIKVLLFPLLRLGMSHNIVMHADLVTLIGWGE